MAAMRPQRARTANTTLLTIRTPTWNDDLPERRSDQHVLLDEYLIRGFPHAVKTNVGPNGKPHDPLTFADIDPAQINLNDGAYARGPIGSSNAFEVHNIGEVWAMALLEVRARFVNRLGLNTGNQRVLQFVTDGMNSLFDVSVDIRSRPESGPRI
jgi:hypothetical protein